MKEGRPLLLGTSRYGSCLLLVSSHIDLTTSIHPGIASEVQHANDVYAEVGTCVDRGRAGGDVKVVGSGRKICIQGIGELGICGAGASIANAVYNACGIRIRDYPITLDKLLSGLAVRA